jgi:hypothetical protein
MDRIKGKRQRKRKKADKGIKGDCRRKGKEKQNENKKGANEMRYVNTVRKLY